MAEDTDYKHGEMDIEEHQKTFDQFVHFWFYLFLAAAVVLIFLALTNS